MNRHLTSAVSATVCLSLLGCVSTGELDEKLAQVGRERRRSVGLLEHRIDRLQEELANAKLVVFEAITEEALVRGAEAQTLREQLDETEAHVATELASVSRESAEQVQLFENDLSRMKRELSARIDVEAMSRVDEQRLILEETAGVERALSARIETIASARQGDRDQIIEAISALDRNVTTRLDGERNASTVAMAQLSREMRDLDQQLRAAIADARRAIEDAETALYAEVAESRSAILAQVWGEVEARDVEAKATVDLFEERYLAAAAELNELGLRLDGLREHVEANRLAQRAVAGDARRVETTPPIQPASKMGTPSEATGP